MCSSSDDACDDGPGHDFVKRGLDGGLNDGGKMAGLQKFAWKERFRTLGRTLEHGVAFCLRPFPMHLFLHLSLFDLSMLEAMLRWSK